MLGKKRKEIWYDILDAYNLLQATMKNTPLYLIAKKIHRLLVVLIILLGISMSITGYMMKTRTYFPFDPLEIRMIHSTMSLYFAGTFGAMALTGLYMFIFPYLKNKQEEVKKPN